MQLHIKVGFTFLFLVLLSISCIDVDTIRPKTGRDFYEKGLNFINSQEYPKAIKMFKRGIEISDPVADEYYLSMCYFELAFTYDLSGNQKEALKNIEILLSKVVSSKEPRILAENLRQKIIAKKSYQNASF